MLGSRAPAVFHLHQGAQDVACNMTPMIRVQETREAEPSRGTQAAIHALDPCTLADVSSRRRRKSFVPVSLFCRLIGIENEIDFDVKSFAETGSRCCGAPLVSEHCGSESLTLSRVIDKPS